MFVCTQTSIKSICVFARSGSFAKKGWKLSPFPQKKLPKQRSRTDQLIERLVAGQMFLQLMQRFRRKCVLTLFEPPFLTGSNLPPQLQMQSQNPSNAKLQVLYSQAEQQQPSESANGASSETNPNDRPPSESITALEKAFRKLHS